MAVNQTKEQLRLENEELKKINAGLRGVYLLCAIFLSVLTETQLIYPFHRPD